MYENKSAQSRPDHRCPARIAGTNLTNLACDFGGIDPLQGLGLQIAALSDTDPHYAGSCGCATAHPPDSTLAPNPACLQWTEGLSKHDALRPAIQPLFRCRLF